MRAFVLALCCSSLLSAAAPKLTFTKTFPGSMPPYFSVEVDKAGNIEYKESPDDDQPVKTQLQEADTAALFSMADRLGHFKVPVESGLKVASTGKKTFRYVDENGAATETSFNYSTNETAQQLWDRFEQIGATERAFLELERTTRFDKLGVNDALASIESLWLRKQLAAPQQFLPLLTKISTHESYMHLVRERAARLKDAFSALPPVASSGSQQPTDSKQK